MATQTYRLEILSPTHIGSGQEYGAFDGVYQNGRWYLVDLKKVLERSKEDPTNLANAMMQQGFNWASWLQRCGIAPTEVASYSVACVQNPGSTKIRACIRDPFWRPYIPGSTLKGAIRTAILESIVVNLTLRERQQTTRRILERDERGRLAPRERVGQKTVERLLLGRHTGRNDSNYDLLRALHVSDSEPVDAKQVQIGLTWVHTLRNNQLVPKRVGQEEYKMFVEWLRVGAQTRLTIRIDERLLEGKYRQDIGFRDDQVNALREFAVACNERAAALMEHEAAFYEDHGLPAIARFYQTLLDRLQQVESGGRLRAEHRLGWRLGDEDRHQPAYGGLGRGI
jgi:CRISPR-associated protein Csm5